MSYPSYGYLNSVASSLPKAPTDTPTLDDYMAGPAPAPPAAGYVDPATVTGVRGLADPVPAQAAGIGLGTTPYAATPTAAPPPAAVQQANEPPRPQEPQPDVVMVGGGGYAPAREVKTIGPVAEGAMNAANDAQMSANAAAAAELVGAHQAEAGLYANQVADGERKLREDEARATLVREENDRQRKMLADKADELANDNINPGRAWARKSTPQKIASFFAVFLGGFGGGNNRVLDMIDKEIDRDIEAQRAAHQYKQDSYAAAQTAYQTWLNGLGNVHAAYAMAKATAQGMAQAEANRQAAQTKSAEVKARATEASGQLEAAKQMNIAKAHQYIQASRTGPMYAMRGRVGLLTQAQVNAELAKQDERSFEVGKETLKAGLDARKEQGKTERDDARYIANARQQAGIPSALESAEIARKSILAAPKGYKERVFEKTPVVGASGDLGRKALFGREAAEREQAWHNFKNQSMKSLMGNVTKDEEDRARAALEGANDNESRLAAIKTVESILQSVEVNIRKGASDSGNAEFDRRSRNAEGPRSLSSVAPSFKPSGR